MQTPYQNQAALNSTVSHGTITPSPDPLLASVAELAYHPQQHPELHWRLHARQACHCAEQPASRFCGLRRCKVVRIRLGVLWSVDDIVARNELRGRGEWHSVWHEVGAWGCNCAAQVGGIPWYAVIKDRRPTCPFRNVHVLTRDLQAQPCLRLQGRRLQSAVGPTRVKRVPWAARVNRLASLCGSTV